MLQWIILASTVCVCWSFDWIFQFFLVDSVKKRTLLGLYIILLRIDKFGNILRQFPNVDHSKWRCSNQVLAILTETHARRYLTALCSADQFSAFRLEEHQLFICARSAGDLAMLIYHYFQVIRCHFSIWIRSFLPYFCKPAKVTQRQVFVMPCQHIIGVFGHIHGEYLIFEYFSGRQFERIQIIEFAALFETVLEQLFVSTTRK